MATSTGSGFTSADIRNFARARGWVNDDGSLVDGDNSAHAMYANASSYGVAPEEIDAAMGWGAGTSQGWITSQGLGTTGALPAAGGAHPPPPGSTGGTVAGGTTGGTTGGTVAGGAAGGAAAGGGTTAGGGSTTGDVVTGAGTGGTTVGGAAAGGAAGGSTATGQTTQTAQTGALAAAASNPPAWATDPTQLTRGDLDRMAGTMRDIPAFNLSPDALVSTQLAKLLASDSPYITRARARAAEYSNSRGLLNSSIGAGAGEAAAIDAGGQIATGDANAVMAAQMAEYEARTRAISDENAFGRQGALAMAGATWDFARDDLSRAFEASENQRQRSWQSGENTAQRSWQSGESDLERLWGTSERLGRQSFESGENVLDRTWQTSERLGSQAFESGENALDRTFESGENQAQRTWQSGENETQRTWQTGEGEKDRTFTAGENVLDRDFTATENATQRTFTAGENQTQREFTAGENAADRTFQTSEREAGENFITTRDDTTFRNRLTEIGAQTANQMQILDKQLGTDLYTSYRTQSQKVMDTYTERVDAIQLSDMDPDVKQQQIESARTLAADSQEYLTGLFTNTPGWVNEWATFDLFPEGQAAG